MILRVHALGLVRRLPDHGQEVFQLLDLQLERLLRLLVVEGGLHVLGLLPQVGRELQAVDRTPRSGGNVPVSSLNTLVTRPLII